MKAYVEVIRLDAEAVDTVTTSPGGCDPVSVCEEEF